ncbi:MAG: hypothetical protein WDO19_30520 [Bacteroidota bacterium]
MTTRWMCHYLAECMKRAEEENHPATKAKLERECCEIILQLWEQRKNFPGRTRPLANLTEAIQALSGLAEKKKNVESWTHYMERQHLTGWEKFTTELVSHFDELVVISLCATVTMDTLKKKRDG